MINIVADNKVVDVQWLEFSDGAVTCKVGSSIKEARKSVTLSVCPTTPVKNVLEELSLCVDACMFSNMFVGVKYYLYLPYLPYGRADRIFEEGNPNPLELFMNCLRNLPFEQITIRDPHNEDSLDWFRGTFDIIPQSQCLRESVNPIELKEFTHILAPDKGAVDKSKEIANMLKLPLLTASKERDISTGRILRVEFNEDIPEGSNILITDDILDGGGTFIPLLEQIRSRGCTASLYVTHLIASKGLDIFRELADNIYCFHTIGKYVNIKHVTDFNTNN